jgi:hypothetical protein
VDVMIQVQLHTATYVALRSVPEDTDHKIEVERENREMFCENRTSNQAKFTIRKTSVLAHRKLYLMLLQISQGRIIRTQPKLVW